MIHHDNRALADYWHILRAGRPCPFRAEIDPRNIRARISNVFILENLGRGNIRFRLAGSALVNGFGMELRGMPLRSIMVPEGRQTLVEIANETLADCGVASLLLRRRSELGELWEMSLMPLRSDQGRIDRLLGALHSLDPADGALIDPPMSFSLETFSISRFQPEGVQAAPSRKSGIEAVASAGRPEGKLRAIEGGLSNRPAGARQSERPRPVFQVISNS